MARRRRALVGVTTGIALALTAVVAPAPAGAVETESALDWLLAQQQADGGFELSGFPGFETPDAVLAIAASAQPGAGWDTDVALAAVEAATTEGGADPLDAVDAWVDSVQGGSDTAAAAAQASKVVVLVTHPLGLDPTDFDPADDSDDPVDLVAAIEAGAGDGSYDTLAFTARLYVAWGLAALGEAVPDALVADIEAAQKPNGSWDYTGAPDPAPVDPDTTATAVIALTMAGEPVDGAALTAARVALGRSQVTSGDWAAPFDDGNPNSTSVVALMAATLGRSIDDPTWRDSADPRLIGVPYPSPLRALDRRQADDGHIASPNDAWGLNTFATTQTLQAVAAAEGAWPYTVRTALPVEDISDARRLVNALYADLLGRPADTAGGDYWEARLEAGSTPAQVARSLTRTREYAGLVADAAADRYLGRALTAEERPVAIAAVLAGDRTAVAAAMLEQPEVDADDEWAAETFSIVLGREASDADVAWMVGLLDGGQSRAQVGTRLLASAEARGVWVTETYQDLLRRNPSAADRTFWVGQLGRGRNPSHLVAQITGSAEYRALTASK